MKNYILVHTETINFKKGWYLTSDGKRYGIKDAYGNLICPTIYSFISDFTDGLAVIKFKKNIFSKEQWGVMNEKFEVNLFSEEYKNVKVLNRKILAVQLEDGEWRIIKKSGEKIPGPTYDECPGPFSDGVAPVKCKKLYAFINEDGQQICKAIFSRYLYHDNGIFSVFAYTSDYYEPKYIFEGWGLGHEYRMTKKGVMLERGKNKYYM